MKVQCTHAIGGGYTVAQCPKTSTMPEAEGWKQVQGDWFCPGPHMLFALKKKAV